MRTNEFFEDRRLDLNEVWRQVEKQTRPLTPDSRSYRQGERESVRDHSAERGGAR